MTDSVVDTLLNDRCLRGMALQPGARILDVGCGFGVFTQALAGADRTVLGIDSAAEVLAQARPHPRVSYRTGDATALPLTPAETGSFDVAVARFVLESHPAPQAVVDQMVAAVRPGGRVILIDDDHEALALWPELPSFTALWRGYLEAFRDGGGDAIIGRKLPSLLVAAGLRPTKTRSLHFGTSALEPTFAPCMERLRLIFTAHRGALRVADADLASAEQDLRAWSQRPDATAWNVVRYAEGVAGQGGGATDSG